MKNTKILLILATIILVAVVILVDFRSQPGDRLITHAFELDERGQLPGEFNGEGSVFDIQKSQYRDITVSFDKETSAQVESIKGMVGIRVSQVPEMRTITVDNLEPNTTYYKYVDHLDTRENITTGETGSMAFTQDMSQAPYIMIFEHPSTYFIESDGGDCSEIGIWSGNTCTLTGNVDQSIEIKDSNIILDGAGHTVQGPDSNIGVYVNGGLFGDITDVTIRNLTVTGFSKGAQMSNTQRVHFENITVTGNGDGVDFYRAETSSIKGSVIRGNTNIGLKIGDSSDINDVSGNEMAGNGVGIELGLNSQSSISSNNIKNNTTGIGIFAVGGKGTYLWRNNILDNVAQVSILFDGDTKFNKRLPDRGNFWSDHVCTPDPDNISVCTNRYTISLPVLPDKYDDFPWACEDAWIDGCDAPHTNPGHCSNLILDSDEIGVDCGGSCSKVCSACVPIIINASTENNIDVVFVGSGFDDVEVLRDTVNEMIDYDGDLGGGLFSFEPFAGEQDKFNFWRIDSLDTMDFGDGRAGLINQTSDLINSTCPINDQKVLLSVEPRFRSFANISNLTSHGGERSFVTIGCEYTGDCVYPLDIGDGILARDDEQVRRMFVHEIGHSFGGLRDEYVGDPDSFSVLPPLGAPNCDGGLGNPKWNDITPTEFDGCTYNSWVRPYASSLMRSHFRPYIDFLDVNELELTKDINDQYNENFPTGASSVQSYVVRISYNENDLIITDANLISGKPPQYSVDEDLPFIEMLDAGRSTLKKISVVIPNTISLAPFEHFFDSSGEQIDYPDEEIIQTISSGNFSMVVPYYEKAEIVAIYDKDGIIMDEYFINGQSSVTPTPTSTPVDTPATPTASNKMTICHIPPGNPANAHKIEIGKPAWKAHEKHGDLEGDCEDEENQEELEKIIEEKSKKKKNKK